MEAEGRTADTEAMGVKVGSKGIHPTLPTPNMDRYNSAVSRPTVREVIRDECWCQGNGWGVHDGKRRGDQKNEVNKIKIFAEENILKGLAISIVTHYSWGLATIQVTHSCEARGCLHSDMLTIKIEADS